MCEYFVNDDIVLFMLKKTHTHASQKYPKAELQMKTNTIDYYWL